MGTPTSDVEEARRKYADSKIWIFRAGYTAIIMLIILVVSYSEHLGLLPKHDSSEEFLPGLAAAEHMAAQSTPFLKVASKGFRQLSDEVAADRGATPGELPAMGHPTDERRPYEDAVCDPSCGDHVRCVGRRPGRPSSGSAAASMPAPVCLCRDGFWGGSCGHTAEEWAKLAKIDKHKASGARHGNKLWWYLNSTAYRLRYHTAAALMERERHILEIGGFVTPIDMFVSPASSVETVTNLDPIIEPYAGHDAQGRQVLRLPTTLQEYSLRGDEDAILFLGVIPEFKPEWLPLPDSARIVIVGGSIYNPIQSVIKQITKRAQDKGFTKSLDFTLDFSNMVGPEHPEISADRDNHHRRIVVLERPKSMMRDLSSES